MSFSNATGNAFVSSGSELQLCEAHLVGTDLLLFCKSHTFWEVAHSPPRLSSKIISKGYLSFSFFKQRTDDGGIQNGSRTAY